MTIVIVRLGFTIVFTLVLTSRSLLSYGIRIVKQINRNDMDRNVFGTLILVIIFLLVGFINVKAEERYVMIGDSVSIVTNENVKEVKTKKTLYVKGKEYPIYIESDGRCYVRKSIRVNSRKTYLPETISRQIAEELGYEY